MKTDNIRQCGRTIYLDNAATSAVKPQCVQQAVISAVTQYTANPGRGGYASAVRCAERIYSARRTCADFFDMDDAERIVFTPGCTSAINYAVRGTATQGGHIVISDLEHNAVTRTVHALSAFGVTFTAAKVYEGDPDATVTSFRDAVRANTCMVVCTHASNVFGTLLPIDDISRMCRERGIPMCIDAAQTAGVLPVGTHAHSADFVCVPGHKGLHGISGSGILAVMGEFVPRPAVTGGTGSMSSTPDMPEHLPDRLESGTGNTAGILSMAQGISWVGGIGIDSIERHELELCAHLYEELSHCDDVTLYTQPPKHGSHAPIVSFNIAGIPSERVAELLDERGIAVRAGYHCAYLAHSAYGTLDGGTVRVSPGYHNTHADIDALLHAVYEISALNTKISLKKYQ